MCVCVYVHTPTHTPEYRHFYPVRLSLCLSFFEIIFRNASALHTHKYTYIHTYITAGQARGVRHISLRDFNWRAYCARRRVTARCRNGNTRACMYVCVVYVYAYIHTCMRA
jgi:hypothetical protein